MPEPAEIAKPMQRQIPRQVLAANEKLAAMLKDVPTKTPTPAPEAPATPFAVPPAPPAPAEPPAPAAAPPVATTTVEKLMQTPDEKGKSELAEVNRQLDALRKAQEDMKAALAAGATRRKGVSLPKDLTLDEDTQKGFEAVMRGINKVGEDLESLKTRKVETQEKTPEIKSDLVRLRMENFNVLVKSAIPDWDKLNGDMKFVAFLTDARNPMDVQKRPYAETLREARRDGDVDRAKAVVDAYRAAHPPAPNPAEIEAPPAAGMGIPMTDQGKIKHSVYLKWVKAVARAGSNRDRAKVDETNRLMHEAIIAGQVDLTA